MPVSRNIRPSFEVLEGEISEVSLLLQSVFGPSVDHDAELEVDHISTTANSESCRTHLKLDLLLSYGKRVTNLPKNTCALMPAVAVPLVWHSKVVCLKVRPSIREEYNYIMLSIRKHVYCDVDMLIC